jgi:hypothetical protein
MRPIDLKIAAVEIRQAIEQDDDHFRPIRWLSNGIE